MKIWMLCLLSKYFFFFFNFACIFFLMFSKDVFKFILSKVRQCLLSLLKRASAVAGG